MTKYLFFLLMCLLVSCKNLEDEVSSSTSETPSYSEAYFSIVEGEYYGRKLLFTETEELIIVGEHKEDNDPINKYFIGKLDTLNQFSWLTYLDLPSMSERSRYFESFSTHEGNHLIMSSSRENEDAVHDYDLLLVNPFGDILYQTIIAQPEIDNISMTAIQLPDQSLIVLGKSTPPIFKYQLILQKITLAGEVLWSKFIPTTDSTSYRGPNDLLLLNDVEQLIILNGERISITGNKLLRIQSINFEGDFLWEKVYKITGPISFLTSNATLTHSQKIVIAYVDDKDGNIGIVQLDWEGNEEWHYRLRNGSRYIKEIIQTNDGNYLLSSTIYNDDTGPDILLTKISQDGHIIWEKTYGSASGETATGIIEKLDGTLIILGNTNHYTDIFLDSDMFLIYTDEKGDPL